MELEKQLLLTLKFSNNVKKQKAKQIKMAFFFFKVYFYSI